MTQHDRETLLADSGGAHPTDRAGHEPSPEGLGHTVAIPCAWPPNQFDLSSMTRKSSPPFYAYHFFRCYAHGWMCYGYRCPDCGDRA